MKRKHKTYSRPKRPFEKARIDEEAEIKKEFGLKNKKEIWKSDSEIKSIRERAKELISADADKQQALFERLKKKGFKVNSISDVLSLDKKDYLKRRLQTVLVAKGLTTTTKSARQLITHKKVLVGGRLVDSPSYIVPLELENKITLKLKNAVKKEKKIEEAEQNTKPEEINESEEENE
jgi:small subunit ribosomal protein S4